MSEENKIQKMIESSIASFNANDKLTPALLETRRERIMALEEAMATLPNAYGMHEFNEGKINHHFATGVYGRELFIPAGQLIVSKIHKAKTLNIVAAGTISVICPHKGFNTYTGPHVFVSEPLTKRVVISHTDVLWITAHGYTGESQDLDVVEEHIIAKNFEDNLLKDGGI